MSRPIIYSKLDEQIIKTFRCGAKIKNANQRFEDSITVYDVLMALKRFGCRYIYCNNPLKPKYWQLDHFYPRALGGKNIFDNLVPTCRWCNTMKNALDGHAFILFCKKVASQNQLDSVLKISSPVAQSL